MLYERMLRLFSGEVRVLMKEGFPSFLLGKCKEEGIGLRFVVVRSEEAEATVKQKDLARLLKICKDLGMRAEILYQKGLPQFINRYRSRIGIPVGVLLGAFLLAILSSFLWSVDVDGTNRIDRESLYAFLNRNNIKTGVFLCGIDVNRIEKLVESYDERIQKATVNLIGCKLYVTVHEREMPPEIEKIHGCFDLVAKKDGEIVKADITAGKSCVNRGDVVLKGDLLAAGAVPLSDGNVFYTQANGIVYARTHNRFSCTTNRRMEVVQLKPVRTNRSVLLFGIEAPLRISKGTDADLYLHDRCYYCCRKTVFPIGIHMQTRIKKENNVLSLTEKQASLLCATDLAVRGYEKLSGCVVTEQQESFRSDPVYALDADFVCLEEIGEQRSLFPIQNALPSEDNHTEKIPR